MQIKHWDKDHSADSLLVLLREEDCKDLTAFDGDLRAVLADLVSRKDFTGKKGSLLRVPMTEGTMYLAGLGKKDKCTLKTIRDSLASGLRTAGKNRAKSAYVPLAHLNDCGGLCFALGEAGGL